MLDRMSTTGLLWLSLGVLGPTGAAGCATIPSEAPELSVALGERISALEQSNIVLLQRYFELKRGEVDRFLMQKWVPQFTRNLLKDETIAAMWQQVAASEDPGDRAEFMLRMGPKIQQQINEKRVELMQPLETLERRIETSLRDEYRQARAINNSLTSFLHSAAEVSENRERYLKMLGASDARVTRIIDAVDASVADLVKGGDEAEKLAGAADSYIEKLRELASGL
jgi:hypothetical protein